MYNSIYLTTTEPHCGKSIISLGLTRRLLRQSQRLAVFRPIINTASEGERDKNIDLLLSHFQLDVPYERTYAFQSHEASELLAQNEIDKFLSRIIGKFKYLEDHYDFVLCIGSDLSEEGTAFEFDANVAIAQALRSPVVILTNASQNELDEVLGPIHMALDAFRSKGCPVVGVIVNRAAPERTGELRETLRRDLPPEIAYSVIPDDPMLGSPTLKEIADHLHAEVLYGEGRLDRLVPNYMVIAMQMQNYLPRLKDQALLITPGDRGEIILSALEAHRSSNYPPVAGLLLTTGEKPHPAVKRLLDGLPDILPILAVETETFETVSNVNSVRSYITAANPTKIALGLRLYSAHVDVDAFENRFALIERRGISPQMFLYSMTQRAKADKKHIVLPEGDDPRILRAAEQLLNQNVADLTLIGDETKIQGMIADLGLNIDPQKVVITQPENHPKFEEYAQTYFELRQHKGITMDYAIDAMRDVSFFGTMMVYKGDADGMVSGAAHSTAHTIRPAFQFIKTKPEFSVVSSVFFMALEDRVLVYGDCAVVPRPTAEELAEIAIASAETAKTFGIDPKIAMLSYSSGTSGTGEEVDRVRKATELARTRRPDLLIEGPIQYDAAVDMSVGQSKMPGSEVAGRATVLIFPDLNTGNNTYKAVQRETGAIAVGPVLQGLNKPVNDLSRGCTVDDIVNTVVITAIQAQNS
ncbi:MAG TPA: phosphate acetyltransferase [Chloroflexi bacterium]|nr:phosphate acetyltransferase [Chloroflexota bacterium]